MIAQRRIPRLTRRGEFVRNWALLALALVALWTLAVVLAALLGVSGTPDF